MMSHREHLFTFYLKVGIPQFAAEKISFCFKYVLCYPSFALFSAPSCTVIIFNGAPSSAPVYFYLWDTSFSYCKNLLVLNIFLCYPSCALFSAPSCAVSTFDGVALTALVYFLIECWYTSCCCSEISVGLKYFCVTHRVHFVCPIVCIYYFLRDIFV